MKNSPNPERNPLRKLGLFAVIVGDLFGYSAAGVGLGYLAWSKLGAPWWVLLVTSITGLSLAFYKIYRLALQDDEAEFPQDKNS